MSNLNLLAGVQNPFLWESDEMESVESWLGVLICRAGGAVAGAVSEAPGMSARDESAGVKNTSAPSGRRPRRVTLRGRTRTVTQ